ncbi:MAG TPA: SGNH/GDSL hydrolase family protein [Gammaproteobacteria bacterium]|nr:SGNH/GDSL hydrolase family protein [Gammaproteobacteria bacterium]
MKTILCYGDSITWGYIPGDAGRYPLARRWPSVLQAEIGTGFQVVAEGLRGRYTVHDEPFRPGRNGAALLEPILETHSPVDLLVIFLGTNDVLHHGDMTASDAARGVEVLARIALGSETGPAGQAPRVMLVSPPRMGALSSELAELCHGDPARSAGFSRHYRAVAEARKLFFLDAADIVEPSPVDGVHLEEAGHAALGKAVAGEVLKIFRSQTTASGTGTPAA